MDQRPIGVFDSGLGGLTAFRRLRELLPGEELIYFGDTGRVPYGGRSRAIIQHYARQDVAFLRSFAPKAIVVACGTVTSNALEKLQEENDLPILGVVEPAARRAVERTKGKVGIIGTAASIRSGAYERAIQALAPEVELLARACPLFVPLVENGHYAAWDPVVELIAEEYLAPFREWGADTLILGCTHYPLLREAIAAVMGPEVELIDTGAVCAEATAAYLARAGLLSGEQAGTRRYYVSDSAENFAALASPFLGGEMDGPVEQIDIEAY